MSAAGAAIDWVNQALRGRFDVLRLLSQGGMARVYIGTDRQTGETVVIKSPRPELFANDKTAAKRFADEMKVLAKLEHRHIVPMLEFGDHRGCPYLVMKYLEGGSLVERRERSAAADSPDLIGDMARWLPPIASALDFLHDNGFLHRDIKPSNIMFDGEGNPYLCDFGLVKSTRANNELSDLNTRALGLTVGTPRYMAPERIMGGVGSRASEVFGLAVVVYEWLVGEPPFPGSRPDVVLQQQYDPRRPHLLRLPTESPRWVEIFARALDQKPSARPASCGEFVNELAPIWKRPDVTASAAMTDTHPTHMPGIDTPLPAKPARRPRRRWLAPTLALIALVAVLSGLLWNVAGFDRWFPPRTVTISPNGPLSLGEVLADESVHLVQLRPGRYRLESWRSNRAITLQGIGAKGDDVIVEIGRGLRLTDVRFQNVTLETSDPP